MSVLVTGGAGYIGAHVVRLLESSGEDVIVVDDLSTGEATRIPGVDLINVDLASDEAWQLLTDTMIDKDVDTVIHLAARKEPRESVERPAHYYRQNVGGLANVLRAMYDAGVKDIIFTSSAAVYGKNDEGLVTEDSPTRPMNPYGRTKVVGEQLLADARTGWGLRPVSLRCFNVAGAGAKNLGEKNRFNLVPTVFLELDEGTQPVVFGDDYATPDGSCVRDYVHVEDVARAHVEVMNRLRTGALEHDVYNVGTGTGSSVFTVLEGIRAVSGNEFEVRVAAGRQGDPANLVADTSRLHNELGFKAEKDLEEILASAWQAHE